MRKYWLLFCTEENFSLALAQSLWALRMTSINKGNWERISQGDFGFFSLGKKKLLGFGKISNCEIRKDGIFKNYPLIINFDSISTNGAENILDYSFMDKNRKGGIINVSDFGKELMNKITLSTVKEKESVQLTSPTLGKVLPTVSIQKIKKEVRTLVQKGLFERALEHKELSNYLSETDKDLYNEIIVQIGFIKTLKRNARTGMISNDEDLLQQRKLMYSLLDLIERIE